MKATFYKCEWMMKGVVADYSEETIELPEDSGARLDKLKKLVGGWIDIYNHEGNDVVLNDEGLLLELPLNPWAHRKGLTLAGNLVVIDGKLP